MNASRRQYFEQRLLSERRRLRAQLEALSEQARQSDDTNGGEGKAFFADAGDDGTRRAERALATTMAAHEAREIAAIDAALRLLYEDPERYGRCVDCKRPIASARLDILPWALRCGRHEALRAGGAWRAPATSTFTSARARGTRPRRRS